MEAYEICGNAQVEDELVKPFRNKAFNRPHPTPGKKVTQIGSML